MTEPARSRVIKDVNGGIGDHLRNHIHFTNYIHLKNHMYKHSLVLSGRSITGSLIALQRSRSLWEPSASPPSGHSHSVDEPLPPKCEKEGSNVIEEDRRLMGTERPRQKMRLRGKSPPFSRLGSSRITPMENHEEAAAAVGENRDEFLLNNLLGKSDSRERKKKQKAKQVQDPHLKRISEHLNKVQLDSRPERMLLKPGRKSQKSGGPNYGGPVNRGKGRMFQALRGPQAWTACQDVGAKNMGPIYLSHHMEEEEAVELDKEEAEEEHQEKNDITRAPRSGCGTPWNLSRIHHRGRTILDKAGRSLSLGLSEGRRDGFDLPLTSDTLNEFSKSKMEALPLLGDSQGSCWKLHDSAREFGNFADYFLKHDLESDHTSDARSNDLIRPRTQRNFHQNLIQKYAPRSFRDLVGQNLVAHALSNAVVWQRIGLLYVFYGPYGTGKTSCARIFARAINCQSWDEPKPCGYCSSCDGHYLGKSQNVREVGPISNFNFESIINLLDNMAASIPSRSQYKVVIFDDCDALSGDCWDAISKVIERAPRNVVFILVCSSLKVLPHIIISRSHKFFFPKLKDADIIYALQRVSSKERLEVDEDALKLITWRSDGSLRDALMTLDQLSLLGDRISVTLVQELIGLISDEKLVDLLDSALSTDTVNTVKNLRVLLETGVGPLALMSQLATVVTDLIAGTYDFTAERSRRKFFKNVPLSKEEMERLRQALKTLLEAEKMLRLDNDKMTWLTAALLQLAPDKQCLIPKSSVSHSFSHRPLAENNVGDLEYEGQGPAHVKVACNGMGWPLNVGIGSIHPGSLLCANGPSRERRSHSRGNRVGRPNHGIANQSINDIWLEVISKVPIGSVKEFLLQEGRLLSVTFGAAPTVQLLFSSQVAKTNAEKLQEHVLQAFRTVLGSTVTIKISCQSKHDMRNEAQASLPLPDPGDGASRVGSSEIVELDPSPRDPKTNGAYKRTPEEGTSHMKVPPSYVERRKFGEKMLSQSIVKRKVSLADVIQHAGGRSFQLNSWLMRRTFSQAKKLEEKNMRLKPRSRSWLCCKVSQTTRLKLFRLKIRARRRGSLLKLISCGKCLCCESRRVL